MTLLHFDTPMIPRPRAKAHALHRMARLVRSISDLLTRIADAERRRREQRALEALPFDLRKDLGWPAGDIHSR
jgi:hypothetical protein